MKTVLNIYWKPNDEFKKFIDSNRDRFIVINGGSSLINENDEWIKQNVIFDNSEEDNISHLNKTINEMTSLYFIWKNQKHLGDADVVSFGHYRKFLDAKYLDSEIIVPYPIPLYWIGKLCGVEEQYHYAHYWTDFNKLKNTLMLKNQYDENSWNEWKGNTFLFAPCNSWVMTKELMNEYCTDLFDVVFDLISQIDVSDRDDYQKRACAFLCERYTSYWMWKKGQQLKIFEDKMIEYPSWKPDNSGDKRGYYDGVFKGDVTVMRYLNEIKGRMKL